MTSATVGRRFQVVIPKEERLRLGIKPMSRVNVEARKDCLVFFPVTNRGLRGLGASLADGTDATDYVRRLRKEWEQRS
ncbi:MAG: AbrB/MazE/SpoVT family DNA-binding domain-containing protein [bacterium]